MSRFEQTTIWQKTLAKQLDPDIYEKEREFLRVGFENFRERAQLLAGEIARVLPEFTVHDITHIDALWEMAELVCKEDYELTPAEGYVLGGAFLIHDLGMGLASYPHGVEELKKDPIWNDTASAILKSKLSHQITKEDLINLDKETERMATEKVLRLLHAKRAEKLALTSWKGNAQEDIFLIENSNLRESYGSIIGLIAHSHWWQVEELGERLPKMLGAPGIFPSSWTIDPVKIACILRIADAAQIDDRRAPSFLRAIRNIPAASEIHWNFQQKLYQPRLERNRLVYTSKSSFTIHEVDSWWVCYDTLQMIDNQLKEVDSLLIDTNKQRLKASGVASIEDPNRLSKLITVDGWQPVDAKIKVSNVAKLVTSLGGKQLYGDNSKVPLRELIQNASDAIRARRLLENEAEEFGDIIIRIGKDAHGNYIEVEDNGIGMSSKVLIGPFLDFGQSFWGTSLMHEELPGLESKGFISTGKYGIGFFSVFMWGEKVTVASKRYENSRESTLILEFIKGVSSRPILRKATSSEVMKNGGTRIRVWVSNNRTIENILERNDKRGTKIKSTELIERLCPSIDCNIFIEEAGTLKSVIKANDWISIKPLNLLKRIIGFSYFKDIKEDKSKFLSAIANNMSVITDKDGHIVGRLLLYNEEYTLKENLHLEGVVTVGGFRTSEITGLLGVLPGESGRASRDIGIPIIDHADLKVWATKQADLLAKQSLDKNIQIACASIIRRCGGNTSDLKIAYHKSGMINFRELKEIIKETNKDEYLVIHDAKVFIVERDTRSKINFQGNVFWVGSSAPGVLQTRSYNGFTQWPKIDIKGQDWFHSVTLKGLIIEAISEVWGIEIDKIISFSNISSDDEKYSATVGHIEKKAIVFDHIDIIKRPQRK